MRRVRPGGDGVHRNSGRHSRVRGPEHAVRSLRRGGRGGCHGGRSRGGCHRRRRGRCRRGLTRDSRLTTGRPRLRAPQPPGALRRESPLGEPGGFAITSRSRGLAVLARVGARAVPGGELVHHLRAPEEEGRRRADEAMAPPYERLADRVGETGFERHVPALGHVPAGGVARRLGILAIDNDTKDDLHVSLRRFPCRDCFACTATVSRGHRWAGWKGRARSHSAAPFGVDRAWRIAAARPFVILKE